MKALIASLFLVCAVVAQAQDKYAGTFVTTAGKIHFFSATPLEDIDATSKTALCAFNTVSKKVNVQVKITSFVFPKTLMQDHFNENYLESEKYPTSVLDGVILEDIDYSKDGVYDVTFKGTLEMHGVKHEREIKCKLTVKNGQPANVTTKFDVRLEDHKIQVPQAVSMNIAEVIAVDVNFDLQKYQPK
ncbi:MAG: YceI family protein [Chitinophagales bacterium]